MKCPHCGADNPPDAMFCGACGKLVRADELGGLATLDPTPRRDGGGGAAPARLAPGAVFADRYEIAAVIGEGGMGVVYRARDRIAEKDVALKLLRADRLAGSDPVKRLIQEGVLSRDIRHANVVAVYDVGEAGGQPFMSMEYLDGRSLRTLTRERLAAGTEWPLQTVLRIIREILDALDAAHKAGVVHRDLKPENVMVLGEPTPEAVRLKVLDFGIARAAGTRDTGSTATGTVGYMAPEQITAPDAVKPSADLYSLSVMFYELLVGVLPQGFWQPPSGGRSEVPRGIDELIQRGLSNDPRARPQSVADYRKAVVDALKAGGGQPRPAPKPVPPPQPARPARPQPEPGADAAPAAAAGWWSRLSGAQKLMAGGAAAFAALLLIGVVNNLGDDPAPGPVIYGPDPAPDPLYDPDPYVGPDDDDPEPAPPPQPAYPVSLSGSWYDDFQNYWDVSVDAYGRIVGRATSGPMTGASLSGQVSGAAVSFTVSGPGGYLTFTGAHDGGCHIGYQTYDAFGNLVNARLHINHPPGGPCP